MSIIVNRYLVKVLLTSNLKLLIIKCTLSKLDQIGMVISEL